MRAADIAAIRLEAVRTLRAVDPRQLWLLIAEQRAGYPTGGNDPTGSRSTGSSTTETAALAPDNAARALHDLEQTMAALRRAMTDLEHLHAMWTAPPRRAMCSHCGDPTGDRHKTHCRWCTEWMSRHGRFPTVEEIVRKQSGGRNRTAAA